MQLTDTKAPLRAKIADDVQAFLQAGGEIRKFEPCVYKDSRFFLKKTFKDGLDFRIRK